MTEYLRCTDCPADWVVSEEDPDSTLSEIEQHLRWRHDIRPRQYHHHYEPGVNRCRDGAHATPHQGCILR